MRYIANEFVLGVISNDMDRMIQPELPDKIIFCVHIQYTAHVLSHLVAQGKIRKCIALA